MHEHGLIGQVPRTLSMKKYLAIEDQLEELAEMVGISLGELDLYLWYMKTGEVLKLPGMCF
jgi:N-glycosylase/DNA lyase